MTFIKGGVSEPKSTPMVLFMRKVDKRPDGCWHWTAAIDWQGYGVFSYWDMDGKVRTVKAHRWLYQQEHGALTRKQLLDHGCHNEAFRRGECAGGRGCLHRRCVNPVHLSIATPRENILRGAGRAAVNARKTHCPKGHEYTEENTTITKTGGRVCRTCNQEKCRKYYYRTRTVAHARVGESETG